MKKAYKKQRFLGIAKTSYTWIISKRLCKASTELESPFWRLNTERSRPSLKLQHEMSISKILFFFRINGLPSYQTIPKIICLIISVHRKNFSVAQHLVGRETEVYDVEPKQEKIDRMYAERHSSWCSLFSVPWCWLLFSARCYKTKCMCTVINLCFLFPNFLNYLLKCK